MENENEIDQSGVLFTEWIVLSKLAECGVLGWLLWLLGILSAQINSHAMSRLGVYAK